MTASGNEQAENPHLPQCGRREVLMGGLALSAFVLSGCQQRKASSAAGSSPSVSVSNGPIYGPGVSPSQVQPRPMPAPPVASGNFGGRVAILPRSAWTRAGIARPRECYAMNGVNRITIHHSAMDNSNLQSQSDVARHIESIRGAHIRNGWADIGYHFIVDPQGRVWEARTSAKQGAHVKDQNEHNLGMMLLGNFEHQRPTPQALDSLQSLIAMQMRTHRVPIQRVYTHREIGKSACPGRVLQSSMVAMRSRGGQLALASEEILDRA